jgi:hypothetical protein
MKRIILTLLGFFVTLLIYALASAQTSSIFTSTPPPTECTINCPAGPAGPAGEDGKDGKDGRDGIDGKDGAPGTCEGSCPTVPVLTDVHVDWNFVHPWTAWHEGDIAITAPQKIGQVPQIVYYFKHTDTMVIVDLNRDPSRNVLAFKRGAEPGVIWQAIAGWGPNTYMFTGPKRGGFAYTCILSLDRMVSFVQNQGWPLYWSSLELWKVGKGTIPVIPTTVFDEAVAEETVIP